MNRTTRTLTLATAGGAGLLLRRPWLRWGASRSEVHRPLPGDELIPHPMVEATRAITVRARAEDIWPWLVQMGHKRAGWYGLDRFDNAGVPSAERIIPELQHLAVGDVIPDAIGPFSFRVALMEPGRALIYRATIHPITGRPVRLEDPAHGDYLDFSWGFVLDEVDEATTRLIARVRYTYSLRRWLDVLVQLFEVADFVFSVQTLPGIKRRAEAAAGRQAAHDYARVA